MCTLFSNALTLSAVEAFFAAMTDALHSPALPNPAFAPDSDIPVLLGRDTPRALTARRWGWRTRDGGRLANARSETAGDKPFFARHADSRRCAVPADSFFEFRRANRALPPWRFSLRSAPLFGLAGFLNDDGEVVLLTTEPNARVKPVHNRMPVILPAAGLTDWLDPCLPFRSLPTALFEPWPAADTVARAPASDAPPLVQTELF